LPAVLYGCETRSLTLRKEHRLKVGLYENRVLRTTFGPKRDEIVGGWRKLHIDELRNLHYSPDINKMVKSVTMRWAGHVASMGRGGMRKGLDRKARRKGITRRT
jgi:hypothetical protein